MTDRRVLITGAGAVSPAGVGADTLWETLAAGRSTAAEQEALAGAPLRWACAAPEFNPRKLIKQRKAIKLMCRDIMFAAVASQEAADAAAVADEAIPRERAGVVLGAGLITTELQEFTQGMAAARGSDGKLDMKAFGSEGIGTFFPLWMLKYLPNMLSCHVSIFHDLQGVSNTVTTGNTSAHQSIGEALNIVQRDNADIMVAGAGESKVHPLVMARMNLQGLLPPEEGEPAAASRPFDKTHAGSLASEGAGILVLEEADHAAKRGRTPLAEIAGFSAVCGGSSPHCYEGMREPIEKAIRRALEQAGVSPEDVSLISACGYGVPSADREEAAAIRAVFPEGVPVTAMKSMLGNAGAGSGAVELVGAIQAMTHGVIPPTLNFTEPDPECAIAPVTEPTRADLHTVVSLAFTLGGQASAIVLKKA